MTMADIAAIVGVEEPFAAAAFAFALVVRHLVQLWLTRRKVKGAPACAPAARRSGWVSTGLLFLCYVTAMGLATFSLARGSVPLAAAAAGTALWLAAVAFRACALVHLAEQFSSLIEIRPAHRLVDTGPSAIVRHPLHVAFGLEVAAFGVIAWSSWAIPPAALVWLVILVRNRTEEAALRAHFGAEYDAYRARVPSMDPMKGLVRLARSRTPTVR